jgi:competence protein ComEC
MQDSVRDAGRIVAAAQAACVKQIDYLVMTHYHKDPVGGVPELAARLPIRHFIDHGKNFETVKDNEGEFAAYTALRKSGKHLVAVGDVIPISGLRVDVVTAAGRPIAHSFEGAGASNPLCANYKPLDPDQGENSRSIGLVITFGNFRAVDLGDLYWNQEFDLVCPANNLGKVDLYFTSHHGKKTSGSPQLVWALEPKVAIMNNGPRTGGSAPAW